MTRLPDPLPFRNPVFDRAILLLAHPVVIAALGVLLINDHVLRRYWPSWWTGKVGDFAWLLFAPFALAALLAWVVPGRTRERERWVFSLSFASVGLVFSLIKIIPGFALMATRIFAGVFSTPLAFTRDPGDLLALPALAFAAFLWLRQPAAQQHSSQVHAAPRGWIALPIAALLTLANSGIPDPGVLCFSTQDSTILAGTGYAQFTSQDGGRSWLPGALGAGAACQRKVPDEQGWIVVSGPQPESAYRFQPGGPIQFSAGSAGWEEVYRPAALSEARKLYYIKSRQGYALYEPGPLDAIAIPETGAMIFAMGHQGLLLRSANGAWSWVAVGTYRPLDPFPTTDAFGLILGGMLYLAGGLALLIYCSQALRWAGGPVRILFLALAWADWLIIDVLFPPAQSTGYTQIVSGIGALAALIILLPLAIEQTVRLVRRARPALPTLLRLGGFALLGVVLYALPYILWLYSTLPSLLWATIFGLAASAAVLAAALFSARSAHEPPFRK